MAGHKRGIRSYAPRFLEMWCSFLARLFSAHKAAEKRRGVNPFRHAAPLSLKISPLSLTGKVSGSQYKKGGYKNIFPGIIQGMGTKDYHREYAKIYYKENPGYYRDYYQKNKEKIRLRNEERCEERKQYAARDGGLYRKFVVMRARCNYKTNSHYKWYGGRGIKMLWPNYGTFKADMQKSFDAHIKKHGIEETTIERLDNDKDYCKENCRWATNTEQKLNQRRGNRFKSFI